MNKKKFEPGAGLPPLEGFFLRYVAAPPIFLSSPQPISTKRFRRLTKKLVALSESMPPNCFRTVVTTKRPFALEHSSTSWSIAMVLEHLILVGDVVNIVMRALSQGEQPPILVSTATVKPTGRLETPIDDFKKYAVTYLAFVDAIDLANAKKMRHLHPWFGQLTALQWHTFTYLHLWVHLRQAKMIINKLPAEC